MMNASRRCVSVHLLRSLYPQVHKASFHHSPVMCTSSGTSRLTLSTDKPSSDSGFMRYITMNDVKRRNALSMAMIQELQSQVQAAYEESVQGQLGVLILQASGPVFSTGHDLKEIHSLEQTSHEKLYELFHAFSELMLSLERFPCPVIASVRGLATAAGCQLVASCDLVVAGEKAQFAMPGIKVGLFCSTPAVAVARALPSKVALRMLFTGEPISATAALQHGLVSELVDDSAVESATEALANKILHFSRPVQRFGKAMYLQQMQLGSKKEAYAVAEAAMVKNSTLTDCKEGLKSFAEKRGPKWRHEK